MGLETKKVYYRFFLKEVGGGECKEFCKYYLTVQKVFSSGGIYRFYGWMVIKVCHG